MARRVEEPTYRRYVVREPERFDEADNVYSRVDRGEVIEPTLIPEGGDSGSPVHRIFSFDPQAQRRRGFSQAEYGFRWAGRTIDYLVRENLYGREMLPALPKLEVEDREAVTTGIKNAARWFGADLVGITELNRQWVYSRLGDHSHKLGLAGDVGDPIEIPAQYSHAIVIAVEMDHDQIKRSPAVEGATDMGYSYMAFAAVSLARYVQQLGYRAIPSGNDTALSVPLAVDAGLGELGRNGLLITERYGPRVRLSKVLTDLPLVPDRPVDLGVQHFCETCAKCAKRCPGKALSAGARTAEANNVSNNTGVLKWPVDADRCIGWWMRNRAHCTACIRVCPFNKRDTMHHRATVRTVARTKVFDHALVLLDDALRYGRQELPSLVPNSLLETSSPSEKGSGDLDASEAAAQDPVGSGR